MLGTSNAKSKHQGNIAPPKLQRIPKSDGSEPHLRVASKHSKAVSVPTSTAQPDKKEGTWFGQTEKKFLHSYDGTVLKPAQNIATMAGKRYIIIPKNNAMSVQPAITIKPDKIGDKPNTLHVNSAIDSSNVTESQSSQLPATEEQMEKALSNENSNELSIDSLYNQKSAKSNHKNDTVDVSKDTLKDTSNSEETPESPKGSSIAMDVDSNELSDNLIPELEYIKFPEVKPQTKKRFKKLEAKSRRSSQNKSLANGTTQKSNNSKVENSNSVDERTSTAILNIVRASTK